jgi:serine/threonine-protein kinase
MNEEPKPPSEVAEQAIPPELDAAIMRCLAKQPEDRFADTETFARALEEIEFDPPWSTDRARKWWAAHPPVTDG